MDAEVWEIEFKARRTGYYYNCNNVLFKANDYVVVAAERGEDIGIAKRKPTGNVKTKSSPKAIIRLASDLDIERMKENRVREKEAVEQCLALVKKHHLKMKLVDSEYQLDGNKHANHPQAGFWPVI